MHLSLEMNDTCDAWGIERRYTDALGQGRTVCNEVVTRLRQKMTADEGSEAPPESAPVLAVREAEQRQVGPGRVLLEDGAELYVKDRLPPDLPLGYHVFCSEEGLEQRLIVSPAQCYLAEHWRAWGWAVQLYAARSRQSWGMGDLADLKRLAHWTANAGGRMLLASPLHAVSPSLPQQPSPYFPTTRRFLSPLYLRIENVPGAEQLTLPIERLTAAGRALNDKPEIARDEVWSLKREALEVIWAHARPGEEFESWLAARDDSLTEFATWCALAEMHGANWRFWPGEFRHPSQAAVQQFAKAQHERVRFWSWAQWLCHRQLSSAMEPLMIMQDLPIGFDPNGADAWSFQDLLATDVTVGAPPDEFNTLGQDWGLPPFVPWRLRQAGYQPFIETLRSTMLDGGGIRIDHVMGLLRLWWIPDGGAPTDGAFVRYPADELLAILSLESHRAGAVVVGEDLGTVEPTFREKLKQRRVLSYRVLWFEDEDPPKWPEHSLASITTHDLPTVAGLWSGTDLEEQSSLGLQPNIASTESLRERLKSRTKLENDSPDAEAVVRAHRLIAQAPARLITATLEDAVAERRRPNIPGADGQRANWCIPLALPIEDLPEQPVVQQLTKALKQSS